MGKLSRSFAVVAVVLCAAVSARAQTSGTLGLGVVIGDPIGGTVKYLMSPRHAVQATLGVSEHLVGTADYVWHALNLTPAPKRGPLVVYFAGGVRVEAYGEPDFGIRTMAGLSYWPKFASREAEFFLELGPTYRLTGDLRVRLDGGFGVRMYFTPRKA